MKKNRVEMPAEKRPWQYILVDFITKLLVFRGYNSILVIYNKFSKMSYFITTTEKVIVEGLVKLFKNNVWKLYMLSESMT